MRIRSAIRRSVEYYRRHGLLVTLRRAGVAVRRALTASRVVLFYCDLPRLGEAHAKLTDSLQVERKEGFNQLSEQDLNEILDVWNADLARQVMKKRFRLGASLWLIRSGGKLAGYGWTLRGRTVEPHYFPLGPDDVQFLDFYVFRRYRGRAIDWFLMTYVMKRLAQDGLGRAYGEAAEWNQASLSSFRMAPFRFLGYARKLTVLGCTFVQWTDDKNVIRGAASDLGPRPVQARGSAAR